MKVKQLQKVYWLHGMHHYEEYFDLDGGETYHGEDNYFFLIKYETRNSALIMELYSL